MDGLEIEQLTIVYPNGQENLTVLDQVDLSIGQGEFVCLLGSSGCGKSTLLNAVAGLVRPLQGAIRWVGEPIKGPSLDRGIVFQHYSLFPWMTAEQNLEFALEASGQPKQTRRPLARQFLELVGLAAYGAFFPRQLSGGMQQRLALARAFAMNTSVLLLDEPFGAVDALTRTYLQDLLLALWEHSRKTILMVTHDVDEALLLADRVVVMTPGSGKIKEEYHLPFERPRRRENLILSPTYQTLRMKLLHLLQQELLDELSAEHSHVKHLWDALNGGNENVNDYTI